MSEKLAAHIKEVLADPTRVGEVVRIVEPYGPVEQNGSEGPVFAVLGGKIVLVDNTDGWKHPYTQADLESGHYELGNSG